MEQIRDVGDGQQIVGGRGLGRPAVRVGPQDPEAFPVRPGGPAAAEVRGEGGGLLGAPHVGNPDGSRLGALATTVPQDVGDEVSEKIDGKRPADTEGGFVRVDLLDDG